MPAALLKTERTSAQPLTPCRAIEMITTPATEMMIAIQPARSSTSPNRLKPTSAVMNASVRA